MVQRTVSIVIEVAGAEDAARQVRQVRSAIDDLGGGQEGIAQILRRSREVSQAMQEIETAFPLGHRQNEMAGSLEDFFRRILFGARSTRDGFKNIWEEVVNFFLRSIREMAAAWTQNLGGLLPLGPGLSPGFGGGGGLGGSIGMASLGDLGIGLGAAAGFPSATSGRRTPTLASTLGLPATMPLGDILARLQGMGPFSGTQVALGGAALGSLTIGNRSRLVSTLGGLGSGALMGFSVGGPIGAAVGAVIGGLVGFFTGGGGKEKRHDADIANQGFAELAQILDDYNHFRRDYASAVDASNRIWSQMQSQWTRPQSAPSQRPYFDAILRSMQQTEDERNRRRGLLGLMPVPEFQVGGLVPNRDRQGAVLAALHPGEFVMSRPAVDRLGVSLLEGLNRGSEPRPLGSGLSVSLEPASAQSLGEMLKRNPEALEEGLLVVLRRGGAASRALRG